MAPQGNFLTTFWSGLSPRERNLVMALGLTFFLVATLVLVYLRGNALQQREDEIAELKNALGLVYTRGAVYEEKLKAKKLREASISSERILFGTLLEEAKRGIENITISNEEEQPTLELEGGLIKRTYKFNLRSVNLEDLVKFLAAVESKPGHVILTDGLLIKSPSESEDRLNVDVKVSTWERREEQGEETEEGESKK